MQSYWRISEYPSFPSIRQDITVDVVVIGGGIAGITAAYQLKRRGLKVCVLERSRIAGADTGHTTAHITYVTDRPLRRLAEQIGIDHAKAVWQAGEAGLELIHRTIEAEAVSCGFRWINGYYHVTPMSTDGDETDVLKESEVVTRGHFDASFSKSVPLFGRPGVEFARQAKFHPVDYTVSLAQLVNQGGSFVFEGSEVTDFDHSSLRITANGCSVSASDVVIATHTPIQGRASLVRAALLQSKIYPYTTYAVRARIPKAVVPEALFWDTHLPYYYTRIDAGEEHDYAIVGGKDHKTGQLSHSENRFHELKSYVSSFLPAPQILQRWSGQVMDTNDGLPFIGKLLDNQYVATGFGGNGMTFGSLAGLMIAEEIVGEKSPWRELLSPHRRNVLAGAWDYLRENLDYPYYMVKDRIMRQESVLLQELAPEEAAIVRISGKRVAAYRGEDGRLFAVSPTCTHLGCQVHWNAAEKTWDCPCHGSRYAPDGKVIAGPAQRSLQPIDVDLSSSTRRPPEEHGSQWSIPPNI